MKIAFIALALMLSASSQAVEFSHTDRGATPKCENIRFTGIAAAAGVASVIETTLASTDLKDTLARYPIQCNGDFINMFGQNVPCRGVAYFKNHKGTIIDWDKNYFVILSPVDLNTGREDLSLIIRRKDARCAK